MVSGDAEMGHNTSGSFLWRIFPVQKGQLSERWPMVSVPDARAASRKLLDRSDYDGDKQYPPESPKLQESSEQAESPLLLLVLCSLLHAPRPHACSEWSLALFPSLINYIFD